MSRGRAGEGFIGITTLGHGTFRQISIIVIGQAMDELDQAQLKLELELKFTSIKIYCFKLLNQNTNMYLRLSLTTTQH